MNKIDLILKKTFLMGYAMSFVVMIFPAKSEDIISIVFYGLIGIIPILLVVLVDLRKYGDEIREILLGFSVFGFISGLSSFLMLVWTMTFNGANLFGIYRSVLFSGMFIMLERIIWWHQTQLKE